MPDYPLTITGHPSNQIHVYALDSLGYAALISGFTSASAVWPAANRALYIPFIVTEEVTAYQMIFEVAVQSGNLDVGIYNEQATRLVSSGSTPVGGAGIQVVNITDTVLKPGVYFMAMCVDNITASFVRSSISSVVWLNALGVQQQAVGAVTLPDPATFANPASGYVPILAVTTNSAA